MENTKKQIRNMLLNLINKYDLQHNNAEADWQGDSQIFMSIEAPNNWTISVDLDGQFLLDHPLDRDRVYVLKSIAQAAYESDPEDEFNSCWSRQFGKQNGLSAFEFVHNLEDDKRFYNQLSDEIYADLRKENYKLVKTGSSDIFKQYPLPDIDGFAFMVVNVATFLKELRNIAAIELADADYPDNCPIDSMWGSMNVSTVIDDLADFHSEFGLIIAETDTMDPEVTLHTLTCNELKTLSELKDWELNPEVKKYCRTLMPYFNDDCESANILCAQAIPSEYSRSVITSNL